MMFKEKYFRKAGELSVLVMLFFIPVIFFTRANDVFETNKMFMLRFFTVYAVFMWLAAAVLKKRFEGYTTSFDFPVLGLLGVTFITTFLTSKNLTTSVYGVYENYEGIFTALNYTVLFYLTVKFAASMGMVRKTLAMFVIATALIAFYGVLQNFGIDFVRWNPETYNPGRFFSTLGNPNFLAAYLVETIPILFMLFFMAGRLPQKVSYLAVLLTAILVLFLTKSRAGAISFAVTAFCIALYSFYDSRKSENELFSKNKLWFVFFGAAFLVAAVFAPKMREAFAEIWERSKGLLTFHGVTMTPRVYIWKSALLMFKDFPLFGTGTDTFQVMFPYYRFPIYWQLEWNGTPEKTHNVFLQVLATQGIAGFGFYALLLAAFLKKSFGIITREKDITRRYIAFGILLGVIAYFTQGLFNYTVVAYGSFFWAALGLMIVLESGGKKYFAWKPDKTAITFTPGAQAAAGVALTAVTVVIMVFLTRFWGADLYFKIGNIAADSGREQLSLGFYEKAVKLSPMREIYWVKYGIAFEKAARSEQNPQNRKKLLDSSIAVHEQTLKLNSLNGYNYNNMARAYKQYGEMLDRSKFADSVRYYQEAIKRDPNNAYFGLDLATVYINMDQTDRAEELCLHYSKMYPEFGTPLSYLGYIYMLRGNASQTSAAAAENMEKARQYYETALDGKVWHRDTATQLSTISNLAIIYVNTGNKQRGLELFRKAVEVKPDYREGYMNLGRIYSMMNNKSEELRAYRAALRLAPNDRAVAEAVEKLEKAGVQ